MADPGSSNLSGGKRGFEEIGGGGEAGCAERWGFDGGGGGRRRVGVDGEESGVIESGLVAGDSDVLEIGEKEVKETLECDGVRELEKGELSRDGVEEARMLDFDLNVSVFDDGEFNGWQPVVPENAEVRRLSNERRVDVIDISSDESEEEGERVVAVGDDRGKGKEVESGAVCESNLCLDLNLNLGEMAVDQADAGLMNGVRRYGREEKGKAKIEEPWISVGRNCFVIHPGTHLVPQRQPTAQAQARDLNLVVTDVLWNQAEKEFRLSKLEADRELRREQTFKRLADEQRKREAEDRLRSHRRLARPLEEDGVGESLEKKQTLLPVGNIIDSEDSYALNVPKEKIFKQSAQPPIRWKPLGHHDHKILKPVVPSLLDFSLKVLADNADAIVSLDSIPDPLKRRLSNILCDSRKMNVKVLDLFVRGSPAEIRLKDCSWITNSELKKLLESFDPKNLRVFQLDLCGQCFLDDIIAETLARSSNSLPGLGIISLRGACRLSDDTLKVLAKLAPSLCSLNLGKCSLLTHVGINDIANALGSSLKELFIDHCGGIIAKDIAPVLKKFENLEVLSVAGIPAVCDAFVYDIVTSCGKNMKDLDLANCGCLTDSSLKIIGETCSKLCALNIANLPRLTDWGLLELANGCRSLRKLKLCRNNFSDEAIAAFLDMSGRSLDELSLNHVSQVGSLTAVSVAKCSRLLALDLSWCRRVTNEALGLVVDSCWSLKLLKLFGCTQITSVFLNGHSNSLVRIIGLNLTPILDHVGVLEAEEVYLRYSPLPIRSGPENLDHEDV